MKKQEGDPIPSDPRKPNEFGQCPEGYELYEGMCYRIITPPDGDGIQKDGDPIPVDPRKP